MQEPSSKNKKGLYRLRRADPHERLSTRLRHFSFGAAVVFVVAAAGIVIHSLYNIQIKNGATFRQYAAQQQLLDSTIQATRGEIYDTSGITLEDLERALGEEVEVSKAILEKLPEGAVVRSPGMKYKHYAPKADVTLLNGTFEQFKAYVDAHMDQNPSCLCFTGEAEKLGVPCVEYGREGDGADQAKHIFRSLRALDEQGDGIVYARCPQKDGLSMAVYNRLIRAAAFRVIDL